MGGVKGMTGARIEGILHCLTTGEAGSGWLQFLDSYSARLRMIVHEFEIDESRAQECFDFVCAKLSDNGFRRLTAFNPNGTATFRTWLTVVAANLCIDWRRSVYGRFRTPQSIRDLPEMDQLIFDCLYRQGMTRQECLHVLQTSFPKITDREISENNAAIHALLTSKQRWGLGATRHRGISIDQSVESIEGNEKGPEALVQFEQDRELVQKALQRLEPKQRTCLQLRYQQDLTLNEVARLMGLKDSFHARRKIDAALSALAKALKF
jgi:RNA polymerase sigma factor (sigma-70 family)